ncbi:imelysin family protein [Isoalcanivorax indicus]|uniref:imelysin family protein n=1 Tax=Isoalcanivorax indicus TaxID=2202653 RepID=UPI000DB93C54|nr:imelysin family protein [Isoalcanivorax indicus]
MLRHTALGILLLTMLAGCDREPADTTDTLIEQPAKVPTEQSAALVSAWEEEAAPWLRKLVVAAPGFREAVRALLSEPEPDEGALDAARNAWALLYESYNRAWPLLATRAALDPTLQVHLARTDPWPILPGYVDAMPDWPESGIVYDVTVSLDIDSLLAQQDMTDPAEVSVGFQVLELLLFGLPDAPRSTAGLTVGEALPDHQKPEHERPGYRRRAYLDAISALLLEDLSALVQPRPAPDPTRLPGALRQALMHSEARRDALAALTRDAEDNSGTDGDIYLSSNSHRIALPALNEALAAWQDPEQDPGAAWRAWREATTGAVPPDQGI